MCLVSFLFHFSCFFFYNHEILILGKLLATSRKWWFTVSKVIFVYWKKWLKRLNKEQALGSEFSVARLIIKTRALGAREHARSISCERNCDEGRNEREKRGERIDDTKTAIPTFRPCTAVPSRIREYSVRTFHREEAWQFYASTREPDTREGKDKRSKENGSASPDMWQTRCTRCCFVRRDVSAMRKRRSLYLRIDPRHEMITFYSLVWSQKCLLTIRAGSWNNEEIISEICVSPKVRILNAISLNNVRIVSNKVSIFI